MKRYLMFFGYVKTVLIALVALLGLAIIALDIVMISGKVAHFATTNVAIASVSLVAAALIDIFALLLLFNSRYTLKNDGISVVIAVFFDKVPYDEVRTISVNAVTDEVFVAWCKPSGEQTVFRLNLRRDDSRAVLAVLSEKCAFATVETFSPPEKKDKGR